MEKLQLLNEGHVLRIINLLEGAVLKVSVILFVNRIEKLKPYSFVHIILIKLVYDI